MLNTGVLKVAMDLKIICKSLIISLTTGNTTGAFKPLFQSLYPVWTLLDAVKNHQGNECNIILMN